MMNGWSGSPSAWEWVWMLVAVVALWALAGAGVVAATRFLHQGRSPRELESAPRRSAEEVLADRFARGEIGEDEYWQRLHALRAAKE
jgi:putative membrane protein